MAGNVVGVAMVGALRAGGSASDDADRSAVGISGAGEELEVRGQKRKKGQGAQAGRRNPTHQRPSSRRRRWSTPSICTHATEASDVGYE